MINTRHAIFAFVLAAISMTTSALASRANAASTRQDLDRDCRQALQSLQANHPFAGRLDREAKAILVFPNIIKAGFVFGGSYGEGELLSGRNLDGYYSSVSGSWGLQAGVQSYGYVVFLMSDRAVRYIHKTHGLEIGVGPTVVIVNEGVAKNLSTSTLRDDAYAYIFDQRGLMAGISIEGTKISRINP